MIWLTARGSRGSPQRTCWPLCLGSPLEWPVMLKIDATVVLLTPVVLRRPRRRAARAEPRAHAPRIANSASLLLPVSNLTNQAGLPRHRAVVRALCRAQLAAHHCCGGRGVGRPSLRHRSRTNRVTEQPSRRGKRCRASPSRCSSSPWRALHSARSSGSSPSGLQLWVPWRSRPRLPAGRPPARLARAIEPGFLVFVLGLGVIVQAAAASVVVAACTITPSPRTKTRKPGSIARASCTGVVARRASAGAVIARAPTAAIQTGSTPSERAECKARQGE